MASTSVALSQASYYISCYRKSINPPLINPNSLLIIPISLEQLLRLIHPKYKSSRLRFDHDGARSNASPLHRGRDVVVQQVSSQEKQVRTLRKTSDITQANRKLKSLTCSREVKKRRTSVTSGDALEDTLRALKSTSLAARASKLGTNTLKNLWRLNNPFVSDSVELQQAYKKELMSTFSKTNGEAWTAIAHTVAQSLQPHLRRMEGVDGASYVVSNVKDVSRDVTLAATLQGLFGIDNVAPELLSYIGNEIHRLTVGKKQIDAGAANPDLLPQDLQRAADRLIDKLRNLFSESKESSQLARRLLCSIWLFRLLRRPGGQHTTLCWQPCSPAQPDQPTYSLFEIVCPVYNRLQQRLQLPTSLFDFIPRSAASVEIAGLTSRQSSEIPNTGALQRVDTTPRAFLTRTET